MTPITVTLGGTAVGSAVPEFRLVGVNRGVLAERRDVFMEMPGRAGSWVFTESPGDREIVLSGWVMADGTAAKRTALTGLAKWADTPSQQQMIFGDEPDRYYLVLLTSSRVDESTRYAEVELEFRTDPYAYATSATVETDTLTTNPDTDSITVAGDLGVCPVIELTPAGGTLTSFTFTVGSTSISWSGGTIIAGDSITINSISSTVTLGVNGDTMLTGAFDPNQLSMATVSGSFPCLNAGANSYTLSWTGTATSVAVEWTYRRRYR
jgi:predicted phage tail component-like protein